MGKMSHISVNTIKCFLALVGLIHDVPRSEYLICARSPRSETSLFFHESRIHRFPYALQYDELKHFPGKWTYCFALI